MEQWDDGTFPLGIEFFESNQEPDPGWIYMQYTGIKDGWGEEVYEFDIVSVHGKIFVVVWESEHKEFDCGFWGLFNNSSHKEYYILDRALTLEKGLDGMESRLEIIGNIFENKELLEKDGIEFIHPHMKYAI